MVLFKKSLFRSALYRSKRVALLFTLLLLGLSLPQGGRADLCREFFRLQKQELDVIELPVKSLDRNSVVIDTNLASRFFYSRLFQRLKFYGVFIFDLVQRHVDYGVPIKINGATLNKHQVELLVKIVKHQENFALPRSKLEAGLNHFYGDPLRREQHSEVTEHGFMTSYALPQRVVTEVLHREYSFDPSAKAWRANNEDGLLNLLFAPLRSTPEPLTKDQRALMEEHDPLGLSLFEAHIRSAFAQNDFLDGVSIVKPPGRRNNALYNGVIRVLESFHIGGGAKGGSDREIIADIMLAPRTQELAEHAIPSTFMTLDLGIVRGLLRLRLTAYIKNQQKREVQVRKIIQSLKESDDFDATLLPLFGEVGDYHNPSFVKGNQGDTSEPQSIRVVTVRDIKIKPSQLDDGAMEDSFDFPIHIDLMFMLPRDKPTAEDL